MTVPHHILTRDSNRTKTRMMDNQQSSNIKHGLNDGELHMVGPARDSIVSAALGHTEPPEEVINSKIKNRANLASNSSHASSLFSTRAPEDRGQSPTILSREEHNTSCASVKHNSLLLATDTTQQNGATVSCDITRGPNDRGVKRVFHDSELDISCMFRKRYGSSISKSCQEDHRANGFPSAVATMRTQLHHWSASAARANSNSSKGVRHDKIRGTHSETDYFPDQASSDLSISNFPANLNRGATRSTIYGPPSPSPLSPPRPTIHSPWIQRPPLSGFSTE